MGEGVFIERIIYIHFIFHRVFKTIGNVYMLTFLGQVPLNIFVISEA